MDGRALCSFRLAAQERERHEPPPHCTFVWTIARSLQQAGEVGEQERSDGEAETNAEKHARGSHRGQQGLDSAVLDHRHGPMRVPQGGY
jgi:hypothetical protein